MKYLPVTALNGVTERATALDEERAERRIVRELIVTAEDQRAGDEEYKKRREKRIANEVEKKKKKNVFVVGSCKNRKLWCEFEFTTENSRASRFV